MTANRESEEDGSGQALLEFVDDQIGEHETNIRNRKKSALCLISLGLLASVLCFVIKLPDFMNFGPALIMAPISSYQYSATVFPIRRVLVCYKSWKKTLEHSNTKRLTDKRYQTLPQVQPQKVADQGRRK